MKKVSIAIIAVLFSLLIKFDSYAAPVAQEKVLCFKADAEESTEVFEYDELFNNLPKESNTLFADEDFKKNLLITAKNIK